MSDGTGQLEGAGGGGLADLYRRHADWLGARLRLRYGDEAEDIAQEAWRRLLSAYGQGDVIRHPKALLLRITAHGVERAGLSMAVADPQAMKPIVGRVVERGLSDEAADRHYLIVDGVDGRAHYVDIGQAEKTPSIARDAIIRVSPRDLGPRAVDRTVAEIAAANDGHYSIDLHLRHDPTATQRFAEAHERRLEAMRRADGAVEREADGSWVISPDHLERVAAFEAGRARAAPVPWRPTLDGRLGHSVSGVVREGGISWSFGRGRGGPSVG